MIPEIQFARHKVKMEISKKRKSDTSEIQKQKKRKKQREECLKNVSMDPDPIKPLLATDLIHDDEL